MIKRLLSILLCLCMAMSLLPVTALADTEDRTLYYNPNDSKLHYGSIYGEEYTGNYTGSE